MGDWAARKHGRMGFVHVMVWRAIGRRIDTQYRMKMRTDTFALLAGCVFALTFASRGDADETAYIPYDVTDAVRELDQILDPAAKTEENLLSRPIGMQVRNRWRLWNDDSRLARYFKEKGIYNADLMWSVIAEAFLAKSRGKPFVLRKALRATLSEYPSFANVPRGLGDLPPDFKDLHICYYIQRDDLSVIHVFATKDGRPKRVFIPGAGWCALDKAIWNAIAIKEAIAVPQH